MDSIKSHCEACSLDFDRHLEKCPNCGIPITLKKITLEDSLNVQDWKESVRIKGKEEGKKKPTLEILDGDDLHHKSGKWNKKKRLIDRKNVKYKEVITDPETGEVIHHCEEPLSVHRGHGSAKKKPKIQPKNSS